MAKNTFRQFQLVSYLPRDKLEGVLREKSSKIRAFAYILHDKDCDENGELKIPHFHIVIRTFNSYSVDLVRQWFYFGFADENGLVNTLCEQCSDIEYAHSYLTHDVINAKDKYQYDKEDITYSNKDFFNSTQEQETDNLTLAFKDLLLGVPIQVCAQRYGRDFIIHYGHIRMLLNDVRQENEMGDMPFV